MTNKIQFYFRVFEFLFIKKCFANLIFLFLIIVSLRKTKIITMSHQDGYENSMEMDSIQTKIDSKNELLDETGFSIQHLHNELNRYKIGYSSLSNEKHQLEEMFKVIYNEITKLQT